MISKILECQFCGNNLWIPAQVFYQIKSGHCFTEAHLSFISSLGVIAAAISGV